MSSIKVQTLKSLPPLEKVEFTPLYIQIQRNLMELVGSGTLIEGDLLPSEKELGRIYQVSRATARLALHGLKISGYACSRRGLGTFVTQPNLEKINTQACGRIMFSA